MNVHIEAMLNATSCLKIASALYHNQLSIEKCLKKIKDNDHYTKQLLQVFFTHPRVVEYYLTQIQKTYFYYILETDDISEEDAEILETIANAIYFYTGVILGSDGNVLYHPAEFSFTTSMTEYSDQQIDKFIDSLKYVFQNESVLEFLLKFTGLNETINVFSSGLYMAYGCHKLLERNIDTTLQNKAHDRILELCLTVISGVNQLQKDAQDLNRMFIKPPFNHYEIYLNSQFARLKEFAMLLMMPELNDFILGIYEIYEEIAPLDFDGLIESLQCD